jgi:hypothetical protein
MQRRQKKRMHKRLLAQLQTDNPPLCIQCKERPRHSINKVVYDYCYDCYSTYQREYNRRRKESRRLK